MDGLSFFLVAIGFMLIGCGAGYVMATETFQKQAVERGFAHYHPKTADFTWGA